MSEIEDEAYSEVCEENGRLKGEIGAMAKLAVLLKEDIAGKDAEIERLESLCARAADALEGWHQDAELSFDSLTRQQQLIAELRKAAQ